MHLMIAHDRESDSPGSVRGTIYVKSSNVLIEGLTLLGDIVIDEGVENISMRRCFITGAIKVGRLCKSVSISETSILQGGKGVGIVLYPECIAQLTDVSIQDCLVGISLMVESQDTLVEQGYSGSFRKCQFSNNTTDVVIQLQLRVNEGGETSSINTSRILELHEPHENISFEVSLTGRFAEPLSFKSWPIPLESLPHILPRRGFKSSHRYCHLAVNDSVITVKEDAQQEESTKQGVESSRKRKAKRSPMYTKAEEYYSAVLGLQPGSTKEAVMSAFKRLVLEYHPDKAEQTSDQFILVKKARDELVRLIQDR